MPAPDLVNPPLPVIAVVVNALAPSPATVNKNPPLVTPPVKVSDVPDELMVLAAPKVIAPDRLDVPVLAFKVPPLIVMASEPTATP